MKMMSTGWEETKTKEYKFRKTKETKFKNQTGMWLSLGELFDIFKKLDFVSEFRYQIESNEVSQLFNITNKIPF